MLHTGGVHRWARLQLESRSPEPVDRDLEELSGGWPDDDKVDQWFRSGYEQLALTLEDAPAEIEVWSFLPAPSPLAFWARRQAHETAVHRSDVDAAAGEASSFPPLFAADGVDEMLGGFATRRSSKLRSDPPMTVEMEAADAGLVWSLVVGAKGASVDRQPVGSGYDAHCTVRAAASDLYMWVWNRRGDECLDVNGDASFLEHWHDAVKVRWS